MEIKLNFWEALFFVIIFLAIGILIFLILMAIIGLSILLFGPIGGGIVMVLLFIVMLALLVSELS